MSGQDTSTALNDRQAAFVREYLVDLNATQAAIRAGYSKRTARSQGQRLLTDADIAHAVQTAMNNRAERTEITQDYVLSGIREVAERCLERAPVMVGRGDDRQQLIDEEGRHVWTFDSTGANKAFELLGKHLQLFTDNVEHSVDADLADVIAARRAKVAKLNG